MNCKCENVVDWGDGTHRCRICRQEFVKRHKETGWTLAEWENHAYVGDGSNGFVINGVKSSDAS